MKMNRKVPMIVVLTVILLSGIAGCMGVDSYGRLSPYYDPSNYVGSYTPRQIGYNWVPREVAENSAFSSKLKEEAERDYNAAKNALMIKAKNAAKCDFYSNLPYGTHAPSILTGELREAYSQEWDRLVSEYWAKQEQIGRDVGEAKFYWLRHPQPR